MRTVAIVQARMGSTRLPGKVMADIAGEPMLARVVERSRRATRLDGLVVATTDGTAEEPIISLCRERGWPCFRGSEADVLDRYYRAASEYGAEVVVRMTSDCPLIDAGIIDLVCEAFLNGSPVDYASNTLSPRTFPRGLDVEAMTYEALARAWRDDLNPNWREHVTPYMYLTPGGFRLRAITSAQGHAQMRWTVDTREDLTFVRRVYAHFGHDKFSWREVVAVLEQNPEWVEVNRRVLQKEVGS